MAEIKTLWDAASAVESALGYLEDTLEALQLWHTKIEDSGCQHRETFEAWKAVNFSKAEFPGFHSMHRIILDDLTTHIAELREANNAMYDEAIRQKKEAQPDGN